MKLDACCQTSILFWSHDHNLFIDANGNGVFSFNLHHKQAKFKHKHELTIEPCLIF